MRSKMIINFKSILIALIVAPLLIIGGCGKDDGEPPTVVSNVPSLDAVDVAINKALEFTFSEEMDETTINKTTITLQKGTTAIAGAVSYANKKAIFTPSTDLVINTVYTTTISMDVKSALDVAMEKEYVGSFTTTTQAADTKAPIIISTDPLSDAINVSLNKVVTVNFDEAMDATTINATNFTIKQGSAAVIGAITYTGTTATFSPSENLLANKEYTATITKGAKDKAGNALAANTVWSFKTVLTDEKAPLINVTDPLSDAKNVARNKTVSIEFNEAMDASTINTNTFTLKQGTTAITGIVAYTGTTATFTPSENFKAEKEYTATITTGAKDKAGNAFAANTTWNFTTGGSVAVLATVDLGGASNYVILAKTAINNSSTSAITGHLGLSPAATSYITGLALVDFTGYATSAQVTGNVYAADMAAPTQTTLTTAVSNMITAYNDAAGRPSPDFLELGTGNIGGKTLKAGLYKWTTTVTIPTDVTISGGADDVWIFQIAGDLTQSTAAKVILTGGAQAKNVFWQLSGEATFGATSHFEGTILSMTGITFQTGASMNGRALAQTAVILDANDITKLK